MNARWKRVMAAAVAAAWCLLVPVRGTAGQGPAPDRAVGPGIWFLRVTNPARSPVPLCARIYFNPNVDPWYGDTVYAARGVETKEAPPAATWLRPG